MRSATSQRGAARTEGLRRCTQSVRQLHEQFRANRRLRRALVHPCHLGLLLVGVPLYVQDKG